MNFPYFIARKVATSQSTDGQRSFSRLIIRIAIVAVALSVSVMLLTTALIRGFKNEIRTKIFGFFGHIHITDSGSIGSLLDVYPLDLNQTFYPDLDTIEKIEYLDQYLLFGRPFGNSFTRTSISGVRHIQSFAIKPGIIKTKDAIEGIVLKGVNSDFDWSFLKKYILRGDTLAWSDTTMSREVIISEQTANRLQIDTGASFVINFVERGNVIARKLSVVGIYRTGLDEYDKRFALVDIRQIQRLLGWSENQVAGFEVFLDDISDADVFADFIYNQVLPSTMYAETIRSKFPAIFEWLELQNINEIVIIALMLVVSIINMITALMILILERTNMIGTLKALGTSNWDIRKVFLYYAAYIVLLGLFWGNLIGLGLGWLQKKFQFIKLSEADYYLSYAPIEFNFWTILSLNIGALLVILLFLIIPSYLVTRIHPVQAIKFK